MKLRYAWMAAAAILAAASVNAQKLRQLGGPRPASKRSSYSGSLYNKGLPAEEAQPAAQKEETPAEAVTYVSFGGPKSGWGFITNDCPYYSPDGKRLGEVEAGTLYLYNGIKKAEHSDMLTVIFRGSAIVPPGPNLVACTEVATYGGDPDSINPETLAGLRTYFKAGGDIERRREALRKEASKNNPHYIAAKQARQEYLDSLSKADQMIKEMDSATGFRREKLQNQLRADKYKQAQLQQKATRELAAYRSWEKAHPEILAQIDADPQIKTLAAERSAAYAKVKNLVP